MALILWPLLISIPIHFVQAGPLSSETLTPYLSRVVPSCASQCLQTFIADNYPVEVCSPQNFNCLCITPSRSGYTIGEGALICHVSMCANQGATRGNDAYEVCYGIPGRLPNTHSTLSATYSPTSTQTSRTSTSFTTSSSVSTTSSVSSTNTKSSSLSSASTSISTTSSFSSSSVVPATTPDSTPTPPAIVPATPASSSPTPSPQPALTKPQIAGVSVASVGAAALAFGLCLFLICSRRRRKRRKRQSEASLVGDKLHSQDSTPDMREIASQDFAHYEANHGRQVDSPSRRQLKIVTPAHMPAGGWQQWERGKKPSQPSPQSPQGIGLALGSEAPRSAKEGPSPLTPKSYRTHSQLLPERPERPTRYSLFPAPPRGDGSRRVSQSLHPPIPTYAPEKSPPMMGPRFPSAVDTSQAPMQGYNSHRSMSDPFYDEQQRSPSQGYRGVPWTDQSAVVHRPPSLYQPYSAAATRRKSQLQKLPKDYPPPPPLDQGQVDSILRSQSRSHPPRKKSTGSSQYTRFSNGSASTTFEDIDEELPTQSKSMLTPVAEMRSPPNRNTSVLHRPRPVPRRMGHEDAVETANNERKDQDAPQSAKWKILVAPGQGESLPSSPVTPTTAQRTPTIGQRTPPMRASRPWSSGQ